MESGYDQYRISEVLMSSYRLVWDDFCSWYLEMIKPAYQSPIDKATLEQTVLFFEDILKVLHPFMPFLTEELWHLVNDREDKDCIMLTAWPKQEPYAKQLIADFEVTSQVITEIRALKKDKGIPMRDALQLSVRASQSINKNFDSILSKLCNLSELNYSDDKVENAFSFMVGVNEYFVPVPEGSIDVDAEKLKLNTELKRLKGFAFGISKKLSNEGFVKGAPEQVIGMERKKQADAESKMKAIEEQLAVYG
jgi:valyl-tRNA synthetase